MSRAAFDAFDDLRSAWDEFRQHMATPPCSGTYKGIGAVIWDVGDSLMELIESHCGDVLEETSECPHGDRCCQSEPCVGPSDVGDDKDDE